MERVKKPRPRKARLSSVANAILLTKAFSEDEFELGITALAARLGLAKSTVHRLAATLVQYDILEQNRDSGRYRPGLALFELGSLVRRKMDIANEARPQLRALMEATGESVQLAVLDHMSVLYINKMESSKAVRMSSSVGSRAPAHCTSAGKALLAYQAPEVVNQLIAAGLKAYTPGSITAGEALRAEIRAVRSRGYAVDGGESEIVLRGAAAAIRNHSGTVVAAIGIAATVQRMRKKLMQGCLPAVTGGADVRSRRLGYLPPLGARKQPA